jgi:hypothetical protein
MDGSFTAKGNEPQEQRRLVQPDVVVCPAGDINGQLRIVIQRRRSGMRNQMLRHERVVLFIPIV